MLPPHSQTKYTRPPERHFAPTRQQMAPSAPVTTEALALDAPTLGTGTRLFDAVGHVTPAHVGRPAQDVFSSRNDPLTDFLPQLA